jgi:hypothetical protein
VSDNQAGGFIRISTKVDIQGIDEMLWAKLSGVSGFVELAAASNT